MKSSKCIATCLLIATGIASYGQPYQYPVRPGTDQWKVLNSTIEKIAVCQLPDSLLKNISTSDLLISCLNYPLLNNYTASNSAYDGLLNIIKTFNGLSEFLERPDAHQILLDYYISDKTSDIERRLDKGGYTFIFSAIELLLCHESIINRFSQNEQKGVLKLLLLKYREKEHFKEYFGFYGKMTTAFVAAKYIERLDKQLLIRNDRQKLFTEKMLMIDLKVVDELLITINDYVNELN